MRLAAPSPRTPPHSRPSASIFGYSGLIRQPLPTFFISPMRRGLSKNTDSAHFPKPKNASECRILYLKYTKKNSGVATHGPPRREGDICSHPPGPPGPPAKCWCSSASSRLATALVVTTALTTPNWAFTRSDRLTDRSVRLVCQTGRSDDRIV